MGALHPARAQRVAVVALLALLLTVRPLTSHCARS